MARRPTTDDRRPTNADPAAGVQAIARAPNIRRWMPSPAGIGAGGDEPNPSAAGGGGRAHPHEARMRLVAISAASNTALTEAPRFATPWPAIS